MSYDPGRYTGDGTTRIYTVPFPYFDRSHVKVFINDVEITTFTFLTDTQIQLDVAATGGASVEILRETPIDAPMATFSGVAALAPIDLDNAMTQHRYALQESLDVLRDGIDDVEQAKVVMEAAAVVASTNASIASAAAATATLVQSQLLTVTSYTGLADAVTQLGSTQCDLQIPNAQVVSANLTVPANIRLVFKKGGSLSVSPGVTVTIAQHPSAGPYQIFSGTGLVVVGGEVLPEWWGAKADGSTNSQPAWQAAVDSVYAAGGGEVVAGFGTYLLSTLVDPYYLIKCKDKVSVRGMGSWSVLKAGPGLRTTSRGVCILYNHDEYVSNIHIKDLAIDYNGVNNLWLTGYSATSSSNRTGANIGYNCLIENIHFLNAAGHHFVWFGLTTGTGSDSRNFGNRVSNCLFENCGDAIAGNQATDHSSIYMGCDGGVITGNTFKNAASCYVPTAIEMHGNETVCVGNSVRNYNHGINLGGDSASVANVSITGNSLGNVVRGVVLWTFSNFTIDNLEISGNTVSVIDTEVSAYAPGGGICYTGGFDTSTGLSSNWTITGNTIRQSIINTAAFTQAIAGIAIDPVAGCSIRGNVITGFKGEGVRLEFVAGKAFAGIAVSGNSILYCGYTAAAGRNRAIAILSGSSAPYATAVAFTDNTIIGGHYGSSTDMACGISLNAGGQFVGLTIKGNTVRGVSTADIITPTAQTQGTIMIDHVSSVTGTPWGVIRASWGSRWLDSTNGYVYDYRNGSGTNGSMDGWNATVSVTGPPASTAPYSTQAWKKGDVFIPGSVPLAVGSPKRWISTASGTPGTITSEGNL